MSTSKTSKKTACVGKKAYNCITDTVEWVQALDDKRDVKTRSVFIRTYQDLDVIRGFLSQSDPTAWAYIYHDKDTYDDGKGKEPHFHILIDFGYDVRLTYIAKAFQGQQTLIQKPYSKVACYEYLTHKNNPEKAQYEDADIVGFNQKALAKTAKEAKADDMNDFLDDINALSMREMAVKYGRDYMRNYERYREYNKLMNYNEHLASIESDLRELIEYGGHNNYTLQGQVQILSEAFAEAILTSLADDKCNVIAELAISLTEAITRYVEAFRASEYKKRGDYNPYD